MTAAIVSEQKCALIMYDNLRICIYADWAHTLTCAQRVSQVASMGRGPAGRGRISPLRRHLQNHRIARIRRARYVKVSKKFQSILVRIIARITGERRIRGRQLNSNNDEALHARTDDRLISWGIVARVRSPSSSQEMSGEIYQTRKFSDQ